MLDFASTEVHVFVLLLEVIEALSFRRKWFLRSLWLTGRWVLAAPANKLTDILETRNIICLVCSL